MHSKQRLATRHVRLSGSSAWRASTLACMPMRGKQLVTKLSKALAAPTRHSQHAFLRQQRLERQEV